MELFSLWGSIIQAGGTEQAAADFSEKIFAKVPVLPKDAREASDVFYQQQQGNVLINYENEVLLANEKGEALPYIIPISLLLLLLINLLQQWSRRYAR